MPKGYPKTNAISRVEFFCDDKHVGEALRALVNVAIGAPSVQPVTNAKRKGNGLAATSSGSMLDQFATFLRETKPGEINADSARAFMSSVGLSEDSYSYLFKKALAAKLIKPHPKRTKSGIGASRYLVIPQRKPASK